VGDQLLAVASILQDASTSSATQSSNMRFFLGCCCAMLNGSLSSLGLTMQRAARLPRYEARFGERACYLRWAGIAIYIVAAAPDVMAYALLSEVLCGAFAGFRLAVVFIMAHFWLDEHIGRREISGMCVCIMGTVLCASFAPRREQGGATTGGGSKMIVCYFVVGLALLVVLLVVDHATRLNKRMNQSLLRFMVCSAASLTFGLEKVVNTLLGGFTFSLNTLEHPGEHSASICMALGVVMLGLLDLYLTDRGTGRMTVKVFAPVVFAYGQCIQVGQSIVIFEDFRHMSAGYVALALAGAFLSLVGALVIDPPNCRWPIISPQLVELHGPPLNTATAAEQARPFEAEGQRA